MATPEFVEASFEGPLINQLLAGSSILFPPGQILEKTIGFDAGILTSHPAFWRIWGIYSPLPGAIPNWAWWPHHKPNPPPLPDLKLNVFIQTKRAEALTQANAAQWADWKQPYFRYYLTQHQQIALEACSAALGLAGLVVYAAPCFWTVADLTSHTINVSLVSATNFVEAHLMKGHHAYTYTTPGNHGRAYSEPTEVPSFPFLEGIRARSSGGEYSRERGNLFKQADRALSAAFQASSETLDPNSIIKEILTNFDQEPGLPFLPGQAFVNVIRPYMRVRFFCWLLGLEWLLVA